MALGYDGKLYILAFDHRGSFQKKMFGIEGDPTPEQTETITDAKKLIFEGMSRSRSSAALDAAAAGVLVDEQFGGDIPAAGQRARASSWRCRSRSPGRTSSTSSTATTSASTSRSSTPTSPRCSSVTTRTSDTEMNQRQLERLKRLADWLHDNDRKFLFELLVPATDGPARGGRRRHRPLRRRAAPRADAPRDRGRSRTFGIEVDIWKIEGVDARADAEMLAEQTRRARAART